MQPVKCNIMTSCLMVGVILEGVLRAWCQMLFYILLSWSFRGRGSGRTTTELRVNSFFCRQPRQTNPLAECIAF